MTAHEVFDRFLKAMVSDDVAADLIALYSPDVVLDMPYAPTGFPAHEVGSAALGERLTRGARLRRHTGVDEVVVHDMPDPEKIIVEFRLHGEVVETGEPFARRFLLFLETKDDLIVAAKDYWDPIVALNVQRQLTAQQQLAEQN